MMSKLSRAISYLIYNPELFLDAIVKRLGILLSDKMYLSLRYRLNMGRWINWSAPKLYQEKLQWLKLYDHKEIYTKMVDKIEVKELVSNLIGEQYVIPTLGVWKEFEDIDFESLPNQFVLKTNNGGGSAGVVVCLDKNSFDRKNAKKVLERSLKHSIYKDYREWPYKNVEPKIFAEAYMTDDTVFNKGGLSDYKFTCFDGVVDNVMVCVDRHINDTKFYFFNQSWNLLPLNVRGKNTDKAFKLPKPDCLDEMFAIASKLSQNIPFLRVDLYYINGKPYFGETTFYPASGFDPNILPETEIIFGDKIKLTK